MKTSKDYSMRTLNETRDTVLQYLCTLLHNSAADSEEKMAEESSTAIRFDGFGMEHASFLLKDKK